MTDQPEIRQQFERAAQLATRDDAYSRRWTLIHQAMAEWAVSRRLAQRP